MKRAIASEDQSEDQSESKKLKTVPSLVQEAWVHIHKFSSLETPTPEQVVTLDHATTSVLRHHHVEKHCKEFGYSRRFHRYNEQYDHLTPKEELKILSEHYWARSIQLDELKVLMNRKKEAIRKSCDHNWVRDLNDRGHRSHWDCSKCGAYR